MQGAQPKAMGRQAKRAGHKEDSASLKWMLTSNYTSLPQKKLDASLRFSWAVMGSSISIKNHEF
jgi:hypothetical protein